MTLPLKRNIWFTGFMASGKSRIGSLTAASLAGNSSTWTR